ncbi:MAG: M48 family metalloprotease [Rhodothermales bacterium]|nr:M48 family metalloprotease [Rhodothermales bacterium]
MNRLFRSRFLVLILLLPLVGPLSGCGTTGTNLVTGEEIRGAYTWEQEVQIGQEADPQIKATFGVYDEQGVQAYVEQLGQEVLQTSAYSDPSTPAEIRRTPFHFTVLDSPVPNAMALPGGYIYVTRGLLAHLDNEAQLAMVLGHEIGHVLARHSSRQALSAQQGQLGLFGAAILGGVVGGGNVAQGILEYGGTGVQLLFLKYSRDAEREADRAGVAYAEFAGYDAAEAAAFFRALERLSEQGGGGIPPFLSTHPDPGEREQTIPQLAAQYETGTQVNQAQYLNRIEGIILGDDPRQGFVENHTFYHPDLRFRFSIPRGWNAANSPAAVQIAEPNGRAVMEFTFAQDQTSAEAAGRAFAQQQGFNVSEQGSATVGAGSAYAVVGTANTQQGELGIITYFIEYGGNVYRFLGLTAANNLGTYDDEFVQTFRSFDRLTEARYLNRQPVRLEVVEASRTAPFRQFLQGRDLPPGLTEENLAILNNVQLNETVSAGTALKLPRD